jgi:DNA-binding NarL/FixJ family response regulator
MLRILIADDHEVVRYGLRKILERQPGWEVVAEADDGKDAISKAIETKPDVAVLDYAMPLINGIEATRQIRARLPSTEVLIFTVHYEDQLVQKCLKAGARGYVLKSDIESQLLSAIEFLADHKSFFTGTISETLLDSFLAIPTRDAAQVPPAIRNSPPPTADRLEIMERSVLQLVAEGHTNEQIAKRFHISLKFVETLVHYAIRNGLVER